jgi:hypothetical protein
MRQAPRFRSVTLGLGLTAALAACGGGGSGTGGTAGSTTGTGGDAPNGCFDYASFDGTSPAVGFAADVLPILRNSCGLSSSCHGNEAGPGGQHFYGLANSAGAMTPAQIQAIFDQSVDKPAVADPSMKIIAAGKPEQSFLLYKLDGDPNAKDALAQVSCATLKCAEDKSCLSSMPQGGPALPSDKRDTIRRWIAQGAKND